MNVYLITRSHNGKLQVLDDDESWSYLSSAAPSVHPIAVLMYTDEDKAHSIAQEYEADVVEIDLGNLE